MRTYFATKISKYKFKRCHYTSNNKDALGYANDGRAWSGDIIQWGVCGWSVRDTEKKNDQACEVNA